MGSSNNMMRLVVVCLLFLRTVRNETVDDLISEVFGEETTTTAPNIDPQPTQPNITLTGCPSGTDICKEFKTESLIDSHVEDDTLIPVQDRCCAIENKLYTTQETLKGCGFRNPHGIGFKAMGDKEDGAQNGEFPWMVAILIKEQTANQTSNLLYHCGASMVSPGVVLTAAHCVDEKPLQTLKARAGEWDIHDQAKLLPHQDRNVAEVVIHPDYYRGALYNDIALLFLDVPFEIVENVKPICLPPTTMAFDGFRCFVTGWGKNITGRYQDILKKVEIPIVPSDTCQTELRKTRLGDKFELDNSFICAGGEIGKDTCKGDGGSPLVCPIPGTPDRYYQAGIVSWGIACGAPIPSVYASVTKLRPWIDEQLAYKKIASSFYTP